MRARELIAVCICVLAAPSCRSKPDPPPPATVDASAHAAPVTIDCGPDAGAKPATTIDVYCKEFVAGTDTKDGFPCIGEPVHPTCVPKPVKKLPTLGTIVRLSEKEPDGTHTALVLANAEGRFATLIRIPTQDCDLGDPATVTLELVSAREDADAGLPTAAIVVDSLQVDPPFQGGPRILEAARFSIRCHVRDAAPECDEPTKLGTFVGPMTSDEPPPFTQWKSAK